MLLCTQMPSATIVVRAVDLEVVHRPVVGSTMLDLIDPCGHELTVVVVDEHRHARHADGTAA